MNPLMLLCQMMTMGNNPQQIIQNLITQNPQYKNILNQAQASGLNPKDYVIQVARKQNIDIQPMLNMLAQRGIRL